jgi:hypothetical protein
MTAWPARLAIFYPDRPLAPITVTLAAAALVAVTALAWRRRREQPYLLIGWLWYLVMLAPVLGLVQVGQQACADRYTYLPTLGVLVMVAWSVAEIVARRPALRRAVIALTLVTLAALALRPRDRSRTGGTRGRCTSTPSQSRRRTRWPSARSARCCWTRATWAARSRTSRRRCGWSRTSATRTRDSAARWSPPDARGGDSSSRALAAVASERPAHDALGTAYMGVGRPDEAARACRCDRLAPLGRKREESLETFVEALGNQGRYDEAQELLARSVARAPRDTDRRRELAMALLLGGKVEQAIAEYQHLIQIHPEDVDALTRLAWIRAAHPDARHRDGAAALRDAERAQALSRTPQAVVASALAAAYAELGRWDDAARAAEQALRLGQAEGDTAGQERYAEQVRSYRARRPLRAVA